MRLLSWNIRHGGGNRVQNLSTAILDHEPDVVVLTEFRQNPSGQKLLQLLAEKGLHPVPRATTNPRTNSVAILGKPPLTPFPIPPTVPEPHRCIAAHWGDLRILGLYFPLNKSKQPLFDALGALPDDWRNAPAILVGDFNTGLHLEDETGKTFFCTEGLKNLHTQGWTDVWRKANPQQREYTWKSSKGNGFRIDHLLATPRAETAIQKIWYSHRERESNQKGDSIISDHSILISDFLLPGEHSKLIHRNHFNPSA